MLGDARLIPDELLEALSRYIKTGMKPGDFLQAILRNDLADTFRRADFFNVTNVEYVVAFLHKNAPATCWGSEEIIAKWEESGGMPGWTVNYDTSDMEA